MFNKERSEAVKKITSKRNTWISSLFSTYFTPSVTIKADRLAANPEVPGSIPGATRFSELQWVWNGVHSALLSINEELLERTVAAPV
jgi:hypothetical protein